MTSSLHPDQRDGAARRDPAELSTADLLRQLSDQVRTLVTDEVQLAKAEVTAKGKAVGIGAGLAGAGTMLALAGGLAFVAAAIAALALVLPVWASALIVGAVLVALGGVLALVAKKEISKGNPPLPEQAIDSTKADVETIKREVHR